MITDRERIYNQLLVLRCRRNEPGAMEELVHRWEKRLFYYIRRLVSNEEDACDVLQETWLKVVRGISTLRDPGLLPMWLYRIARNTAMSRLRGRYAENAMIEENPGEIEEIAEPSFAFEDAEQVHHGLNRISLPHREVLTLYFMEDLSIDEIAEVLELASGTVKSRLHFAKKALRAVLEQEAVA